MKTPVEILKEYLEELSITKAYLEHVEKQLKRSTADRWEELYSKEFELNMKLNGLYGDMDKYYKRNRTEENDFQLRRIMKDAEKVYKPLVIEMRRK